MKMGHILYNTTSGEIISWSSELECVEQDVTSETSVLEADYIEDMAAYRVVNGEVLLDADKQAELIGEEVRQERDDRLSSEVDPIVTNPLRWAELTEAKQAEWAAYRTALLNITDQAGFPHNVTWPTKPQDAD